MSIKKVVLGMSGGVDSAVAGLLLKRKGFEVTGVFMRNWDQLDEEGSCRADVECEDAEWVCRKLEIPFKEVNFVKEYWNEVFSYLISEYKNGNTPNPDIFCNKQIKFDHFFKHATENLAADAIATGHYAQNSLGNYLENFQHNEDARLMEAVDVHKCQTFFMSQIPQKALRHSMFPVGGMVKSDVRKIAEESNLTKVSRKRDSTGICFIGKRKFANFISEYIDDNPGPMYDLDSGQKVAEHTGLHKWTPGQWTHIRGFPWKYFIGSKHRENNSIIVVNHTNHPYLYTNSVIVEPFVWVSRKPQQLLKEAKLECEFRVHHGVGKICGVYTADDPLSDNSNGHIKLQMACRAITPGQFAVLYKDGECLGAARIISPGPSIYEEEKNKTSYSTDNFFYENVQFY